MACRAFFCDHSPECEDFACEGHPVVVLPRVPGLHTEEGGKAVQGGLGVHLAIPLAEVPEPPMPSPEKAGGWVVSALLWFLVAVTLVCLAFVAIAYFNS